jgi:hypothetical protein
VFTFPIIGVIGLLAGAAGNLVWAAVDGNPGSIGVVVTGGGAGVVVSVMAWIVKKVVSGELVPIPISKLIEAGANRDQKLDKIIELLMGDRTEQKIMVRQATEANFAVYEYLRQQGASTKGMHPGRAPNTQSPGDARGQ